MDRGYNDYALFGKWTTEEIYFVTRLKESAAFEVVQLCAVPQHRNILSDQLIRFSGDKAQKDCPCLLRRVVCECQLNLAPLFQRMLAPGFKHLVESERETVGAV
jgi:hypothetical protein